MARMTGAEIVANTLKTAGVRHVFGIVSIHNMPIVDAISRIDGIDMVTCRNEQSATHMADGYARATGQLGVALASTGPGTTNVVTGLYESAYASSRTLVITGQAETTFYGKGKGYVHEAENQKAMLQTVAQHVASPRYIEEVATQLKDLIRDVCSARPQPGAMEIPIDLQYAETEAGDLTVEFPAPFGADAESLTQAIDAIAGARKRVILAGGGVGKADASEALAALAEKLDAPVITTPNGKGALRDDHPLLMGPVLLSRPILQAVQDADLMIAVGTRFQAGVAGGQVAMPMPKMVHIDADPRNINLNYRPEVGVVGDAKLALKAIAEADIESGDAQYKEQLLGLAGQSKSGMRDRLGPDQAGILDVFSRYMDRDAYFVRDNTLPGYHWGNGLLPIFKPGGYIFPTSGAIGPGLPLGIGVAIATGVKTFCMHGDGGFMFHVGELSTAAQYQAPVVIVVFNDGGYGVLRGLQVNQFDGRFSETDLSTPDFVKLAESMGLTGLHADTVDGFAEQVEKAMGIEGPVLIELNVRNMQPISGVIPPPKD